MVPTRDGRRMATDVYRPARNGVTVSERFPVLLHRTPYDKTKRPVVSAIAAALSPPPRAG